MTAVEMEKLILLIQERPCLWNQKGDQYHSSEVQRRFWNEVAEESKMKVEDVKKRWESLRDTFRREYKRATTHRSGDSGQEYIPKWPFYKVMLFLKDTMTSRELTDSFPSEVDESDCDASEYEPENYSTTENDSGTASQLTSSQTQQPSTSRCIFKSRLKKAAKRRREMFSFDYYLLEIEKEKLKLLKAEREDSEMMFLMSLQPYLKKLHPYRQLIVQQKLLQVFLDEMSESCSQSQASVGELQDESPSSR